jgi:signal transduction histidine kinase
LPKGIWIRYSVNEARRAVQNLRSNELLEKDFVSLLSEAVNRLTEAQPLQVNYKVEGTPFEFSSMIKHQILRIAEEAVTNAVKHSKATSLEIALKYDAPNIRLEVTDNGQGFEIKNPFSKLNGHFGLLGMNERAEKIGGALLIESTPGFGTKINFAADLSAVSENQL